MVAPLTDVAVLTGAGLGAARQTRAGVARQLGVEADELVALADAIAALVAEAPDVAVAEGDPTANSNALGFESVLRVSRREVLRSDYLADLQTRLGTTVRPEPQPSTGVREGRVEVARLQSRMTLVAPWGMSFGTCAERNGPFERLDGSVVHRPTMRGLKRVDWERRPGATIIAHELQSPRVRGLRMVFVMPRGDARLPDLEARLPEVLREWMAPTHRAHTEVDVPSFGIDGAASLCELFDDEGELCSRTADLAAMSQAPPGELRIDEIGSRVRLDVDRAGVRAVAQTTLRVTVRLGGLDHETLDVNRAFLFFVVADPGVVLAMGRVVDPEPVQGGPAADPYADECHRAQDPFERSNPRHCRAGVDECVAVGRVGLDNYEAEEGTACCECGRLPVAVRRGEEARYFETTCESPCPPCPVEIAPEHQWARCEQGYCEFSTR